MFFLWKSSFLIVHCFAHPSPLTKHLKKKTKDHLKKMKPVYFFLTTTNLLMFK